MKSKYKEAFNAEYEKMGKPKIVDEMLEKLDRLGVEFLSEEFSRVAREHLSNFAQNSEIRAFVSKCRDAKKSIDAAEAEQSRLAKKEKEKEAAMLAARDVAKFFDGKALKGTKKQKMWAEVIRAEKLKQLDERIARILCTHYQTQSASFWIDRKDFSASQLADMCSEIK